MTDVVVVVLGVVLVSVVVLRWCSGRQRVIVVGSSPLALQIVREIETRPSCGWVLAGVVSETPDPGPAWTRQPVVASLERLEDAVRRLRPDRVVLAVERPGDARVAGLLKGGARRPIVQEGADAYARLTGRLVTLDVRGAGPSRLDATLRRLLGAVVACVGLLATAPLLLAIAVAIKLDSRGSVLFRHDRLGLGGRRFQLLKFRTMHPVVGPTSEWADDNRARITRVGKWLRRFRLDELPQFVNVLRGDMSLVGPRPHPVSNSALFGDAIPGYALRATARPGVTGWAQVRYGYANGLDEETEKMQYDLYYIKHQSLGLDLLILVATIGIVVSGGVPERPRRSRAQRPPGHGVHAEG